MTSMRISKSRDYVIYYPDSMTKISERILQLDEESCQFIKRGTISWGMYQNRQPRLEIMDVADMKGKNIIFLADFQNPENIFHQISILYSFSKYFILSLTVILPYFPTGTMERVDTEGQIATANSLSRILSAIPNTGLGPAKIVIFDIHALQERFYFTDCVIPVLQSAIPILKRKLKDSHKNDNLAIAFPDEGAFKRFNKDFVDYPTIICSKVRDGDKRIVTIKEGDPYGKDIVVVDDLVRSGGTLIETREALMKMGCKKCYCFVTHTVFSGPKDWDKFVKGSPTAFDIFYTTDSCPSIVQNLENKEPFQILSIASDIYSFINNFRSI